MKRGTGAKRAAHSPKTHSDILWHFTGGPKWNNRRSCQNKSPKSAEEAYKIAVKILKSKQLRLGSYHEVVKVRVPSLTTWDKKTRKIKQVKNVVVELRTCPVCCVADIPQTELFHHAKRYGKMAVGFKRKSLIKAGFNPVFYTLSGTTIASNFRNAQGTLTAFDDYDISGLAESLVQDIEADLCERCEDAVQLDASDVTSEAEESLLNAQSALDSLAHIMSFVKTFENSEFDSIYAEREWRSLQTLNFGVTDIDTILFPNDALKKRFERTRIGLPKTVKLLVFGQ